MYQPAARRQPMLWRQSNVEIYGIMVAGNCILCLVVTGFGLLLMGAVTMAASTAFESKRWDSPIFQNRTNVPRLIGKVFLGIGGSVFGVGLILLFIIMRKAKREARNYQVPPGTADVVISGTAYPGPNYTSTQPYPSTDPAQQYPPQPNAHPYSPNSGQGQPYPPVTGQGQTYQPVISGQGQSYPPTSGPGQPYPPVAGHGQPYPPGPGESYPPVSGQGQPYPPGPGQSYPPVSGQGQPYLAPGGQQYPPAGGIPEKNADPSNLPYNPGYTNQSAPPSGYPGSGYPPPDAPPPYTDIRP